MKVGDAANFCKWLGDSEVTKFLSAYYLPKPSLAEEKDWIKKSRRSKSNLHFSLDTIDGTHIGSASLKSIDKFNKHAEFGIMIGDKKFWGQGCGTEAGQLLIDYGFKKLKLHRIYLYLIAYNIRGLKSYQKLGFKVEGRFRQHWFIDGYFHDRIVMGMLREEYLKKEVRIKK